MSILAGRADARGWNVWRRFRSLANVAQLVAQLIRNQQVRGSSPLVGSTSHQATLTWPHRKSDGVIVLCRWCSFSEKSLACCGYALVNAGITPPLRYQLFSVLKSIVSIIFDKRKWFANFLYTETNIHSVRLNHVGVSSAYNPPSKRWGICLLCCSSFPQKVALCLPARL